MISEITGRPAGADGVNSPTLTRIRGVIHAVESYAARIPDGSRQRERRGVARAGVAPAQADTEDPRVAKVLAGTIGIDMHNHITPGGARPEQGRNEQQKSQSNLDLADEIKRSGLTAVCAAFRLDFNACESRHQGVGGRRRHRPRRHRQRHRHPVLPGRPIHHRCLARPER